MNFETLKNLKEMYKQAIANYLLERIKTDDCLLNCLTNTTKSLEGAIKYIKEEARKEAVNSVAIILDQTVYEWAVHYFLEESLNFEVTVEKEKEPEKEITLFGEEEVIKVPRKKKVEKITQKFKEELDCEQLSLFEEVA